VTGSRTTEHEAPREAGSLGAILFAKTSDAVVLLTEGGHVSDLNPAAVAMFQCSPERALGRPITSFCPAFPLEQARSVPVQARLSVLRGEGRDSVVEAHTTPIRAPGGEPGRILCVLREAPGQAARSTLRTEFVAAITRTNDIPDFCSALSEALTGWFGIELVQLFLYQAAEEALHLVTVPGTPDEFVPQFERLPVSPDGRTLNERALATKRLVESHEVNDPSGEMRLERADGRHPLSSRASVPLVWDGEPLGTMVLFGKPGRGFTPSEREELEAIGADAAAVLSRRLLIRRLADANAKISRRNTELLAVEKISRSILNTRDSDAILRLLAEALIATYSMDYVLVLLVEPDGRLVVRRCVERNADGASWAWHTERLGAEADERLLGFEDLSEEAVHSCLTGVYPAIPGTWHFDVLPMEDESTRFGVAILGWRSSREPSPGDEISAVRTILDETAIALEHARIVMQLRALDSMKSDFLAAMSHELRTPITAILGFAETLLAGLDPPLSEEAREFVSIIRDQGEMLLKQIENLLEVALLETGAVSLDCAWIELGEALLEASGTVSHLIRSDAVRFKLDAPDETFSASIWVDQPRITRALRHLLENAPKFTERGEIILSAEATDKEVRITVRDTGPGISSEDIPHLFQRYYQSDRGNRRRVRGTGLGLCMVRHIVELHGGRVGVRSELGKGSQFWVVLPRAGKNRRRVAGVR